MKLRCYNGTVTTRFICIVDLHAAVNNIVRMNFVMETLEWIQLALLTNYKIFRVDVNNVIVRRSSGIVADIVCPILTKFGFFYIYSKASDIKFHCNPSSNGSRDEIFGQTFGRMDIRKLRYKFFVYVNACKNITIQGVVLVHTMKAYRGSRRIAPVILNL